VNRNLKVDGRAWKSGHMLRGIDDVLPSCYAQRWTSTTSIPYFSTTLESFLTQVIQTLIIQNRKRGIGANSMERSRTKFRTIFLRPMEVNFSFCVTVILIIQTTNSLEIQPQLTDSPRSRLAWRHRVSALSFAQ